MTQSSNSPRKSLPLEFLPRLGLGRNCTAEEVREAFLRLAREAHPDHGGEKEAFQQLKRDYESALEYAKRPQSTTSAKPHHATIHGVVPKAPRRALSRFLWLLITGELCAVLGCLFLESVLGFTISVVALCILTLLLAFAALPRLPRSYATIIFFFGLLMSATLLIGLAMQGEYSRVYKMSASDMHPYDWLMAASPFYFALLWIGGFCGWSASWTRGNR